MQHGNTLNFLQLGRLPDTEVEEFNLQNATEDQNENALVPKDFPDVNAVDLCAPDTLDLMQGFPQLITFFVLHRPIVMLLSTISDVSSTAYSFCN